MRAYRRASCSAGIIFRGCGVVTCHTQLSSVLKMCWHPRIAGVLYNSNIVALDLFCCHYRRCSYLSGIRLLQLCQVIQRSVSKADRCRCLLQWRGKKSNSRRKPSLKFWLLTPARNKKIFSDSRVAITNTGQ